MSNYEPHHFSLMLIKQLCAIRNIRLMSGSHHLLFILRIANCCSSSGPTYIYPVNADNFYQVHILLYSITFACQLSMLNTFLFEEECVLCFVKIHFWAHGSQVTVRRVTCKKCVNFIFSHSTCNIQLLLANNQALMLR